MNYGYLMLLLDIFAIAVCIATPAHVCGWVRWPGWGSWLPVEITVTLKRAVA